MSLFSGLQTALSGLRAQQMAMDVTSHNIANAGTEGYRRQEIVLAPGTSLTENCAMGSPGTPKIGSGVRVVEVRRMQDEFLDNRIRLVNQQVGSSSTKNSALSEIESSLAEPGASGISSALDSFWNSWQELATSPDQVTAKSSVVAAADDLAVRFQGIYGDLRSAQFQLDSQITNNAKQVNDIAHEIAELNRSISTSANGGYQPNDLIDRRDMLLDDLSKLANIKVSGKSGDELMVSMNGKTFIQGNHVTEVNAVQGGQWTQLRWADDGTAVDPRGGELQGMIDTRDNVIEGYVTKLNAVASQVVTSVNAVYSQGLDSTGHAIGNFFVAGGNASNMQVTPLLESSPGTVATSYMGTAGDNRLAQAICDIKGQKVIGGLSINDAYGALVGQIGSDVGQAKSSTDVNTLSLQQLTTQREGVSGVSLDEEMINTVRFQQAYNACSRVVTVINEMLDTVVNKMGI